MHTKRKQCVGYKQTDSKCLEIAVRMSKNEELILTDTIFSKSDNSSELTNNVLTVAIILLLLRYKPFINFNFVHIRMFNV